MSAATRVVGYIRVSSQTQANDGVGLEEQTLKLRAYALAMGLELVGIEVDAGRSAKDMARPGLRMALDALESGKAEGLIVVKLDRLTRSLRDLSDLLEKYFASRFTLLSLGDSIDTRTAGGRMVLNILTTVTQWEREAGAERTKAALKLLKDKGVRLGAPSMHDKIGESVKVIRSLYETGDYTHKSLAEEMNRRGMPTANGGKWWPGTIRTAINGTSERTRHRSGSPAN